MMLLLLRTNQSPGGRRSIPSCSEKFDPPIRGFEEHRHNDENKNRATLPTTTLSIRTIIMSLLCGTSLLISSPWICQASPPPTLVESTRRRSDFPQQIVVSSSSNAARLLLDYDPSSVSTPSLAATQQLVKQMGMQDRRLEQCHEMTKDDWEQCFFYGTGGGTPPTTKDQPAQTTLSTSTTTLVPFQTRSKIPTW
jgi:hypothetical protein